jgi:flavodoxin I
MFRFDESDPQFLIIYSRVHHAVPDDYRELGKRWIAQLERGERFGIIMVSEPHDHDHDHDDEQHRQYEAEITRLTNDFRRDYRDRTVQINVGYARVIPPEWVSIYMPNPGDWERAIENNDRFAQYNWGIPGAGFTKLEDAKNWIREQFKRDPLQINSEAATAPSSKGRVGLFYGSSTGVTEYIAGEIEDTWKVARREPLETVNIGMVKDATQLLAFDCLILGIPTWNIGQLQDDWDILFPQLDHLDFSGKKIALFGIGDQYGYPDNFLDAVGILGSKLIERGAQLVGYWYDEHYEFDESLAFVDGKLMGLGIDEDNQSKFTGDRIERWVAQIIHEFALQSNTVA